MNIKYITSSLFILLMCLSFSISFGQSKSNTQFKSKKDSVSYIIGSLHAENLKQQSIDLNSDLYFQGFSDVLSGKESLIPKAESERTLNEFQKTQQLKQQEESIKIAAANKEKGRQFLAENKTKKDIMETASGLQYRVIKPGSGDSPTLTDKVTVHYRGTLLDGTKFDASYDRGQPATFPLNGVIRGWTEGLQLMKVGAIYQFFIPSDLAYGNRSAGPIIQPGSALIFEVELISIEPGGTQTPPNPTK